MGSGDKCRQVLCHLALSCSSRPAEPANEKELSIQFPVDRAGLLGYNILGSCGQCRLRCRFARQSMSWEGVISKNWRVSEARSEGR